MNKAITDGLVLMPPAFAAGLDVWSSEDGTPGSATYDGDPNAAFVPADADFGGALEILKSDNTQKLRYTGETPLQPGCYLRITARVKAISGNLPAVRIAAWAGNASNAHVTGVTETGPSTTLTTYGDVVEVSAIVGAGSRGGVDMAWGTEAVYGHFGLDLTGSNGGVVRIDDIIIEDITSAFQRDMMDWVDVLDYGAVNDGVTDCHAAFQAADADANGRQVLVPEGSYFLSDHITFIHAVRFEGTVVMPDNKRLALRREYHLNSYIDAFADETLAFKKAFQALLNFTDHDTLDMNGRRVQITEPLDLATIVDNQSSFEVRRVLRNGQIDIQPDPSFDTTVQTSSASYSIGDPKTLTNVVNAANIPAGSRLTGTGVGREVYVRSVNVGAQTITLSQPLYAAAASQTYTFTRNQYALDFSGFDRISKFILDGVEINCGGDSSGILLAPEGENFRIRDCRINKPKDRAITSHGHGCQDLHIERCHFDSNEQSVEAPLRTTIALNVNANDTKLKDNRFQRFLHTFVMDGNGHMIEGNHIFQGDGIVDGPRTGGIVFTYPNMSSTITGNYIDNCSIEWTNEHDAEPDFSSEYSFGGLAVTGNVFFAIDAASWFSYIIIKPFGPGHFIQGLSVQNNTFKAINGNIDRVERVDTTHADLDYGRTRNLVFEGNSFNGISQLTACPVTLEFTTASPLQNWSLDVSQYLPFGGWSRTVPAVATQGPITNGSGQTVFAMPYATANHGSNNNLVQLSWPEPVQGTVQVTVRVDNPV